jgi:hypothetical protein
MLIYRPKTHRPKLVCYAVPPEHKDPHHSSSSASIEATTDQIHVRHPAASNDLHQRSRRGAAAEFSFVRVALFSKKKRF